MQSTICVDVCSKILILTHNNRVCGQASSDRAFTCVICVGGGFCARVFCSGTLMFLYKHEEDLIVMVLGYVGVVDLGKG